MASVLVAVLMSLTSPAFHAGGAVPKRFTCDGANVSPPLRWTAPPRGTRSLALQVKDPDAPGGTFTHWTIWNLPALSRGLRAGVTWRLQGLSSAGRVGYTGPCPPPGPAHHYVFRLFALNAKLRLARGASPERFAAALRRHVVADARLVGTYGR